MPTIIDIADKLGISKGTVSKALNNAEDVSETLRKRVLETAVEIGYERNRARKGTTDKLCVIVENLNHKDPTGFGYGIIMGFKKLAIPAGWDVDVVPVTPEEQKAMSYDTFMLAHEYKGAFAMGLTLTDPWMSELKTARTPTVLYDNYVPDNMRVSYIGVNSDEGFDLAVGHLKQLGHTRIGYLGGGEGSYVTQIRHDAFIHAMKNHGLEIKKNCIGRSYFISECTNKFLPIQLRSRVTAIICGYDLMAQAVLTQCMDLGYRVPEDLSIIGFDDAPFAAYTNPPLTTIRQNQEALGNCGFYALNSLLNQTAISMLLLRAELITRGSTGPVRTWELARPRKLPV